MFYDVEGELLICRLCPHKCRLKNGDIGICNVRVAKDGKINTINYGEVSSIALDPIEKKPLFHFKAGKNILSVGSIGCNFKCGFCQNYSISMERAETQYISPADLTNLCKNTKAKDNTGIAFTYNEPSIWYEYVFDVSKIAKEESNDVVLVTNGYINEEPLKKILPFVDAMNIDLKAFSRNFYNRICRGNIDNVLKTIEIADESCHVEVTTLLINGYNDSIDEIRELSKWLSGINKDIPLHLTRYYPMYKFTAPSTPIEKIIECRDIAKEYLNYVYIGNVSGIDNNTYCPECGHLLVKRNGYNIDLSIKENKCPECKKEINFVL